MICYCGGDLCVCANHGEIECMGCEDCEPEQDDDWNDNPPRDEFVRRGLATLAEEQPGLYAGLVAETLALLDAGREDRERVDWLEADPCRATNNALRAWEDPKLSFRAAIDQARGA